MANICHKEINFDTLKAKFCGPGKPISKAEFQELDRKIKQAKDSGDEKAKKQLKLEYVYNSQTCGSLRKERQI